MTIPEYVQRLRQQVGHQLLWLPGATAVVLRDAEVLLVRRTDNGRWGPVTGIVDPGEHPARAAVREVREETGVTCEVEALAWVDVTAPRVHANGDLAQYLDHTFRCRYLAGEAHVADDESSEVDWFAVDGLPEMPDDLRERISTALRHSGDVRLGE